MEKARRQLLFDDAGVAETCRVERRLHQPAKYVRNPLMVGDYFHDTRGHRASKDDATLSESGILKLAEELAPTSVVQAANGMFQMYYQMRPRGMAKFGYTGGTPVIGYAESHNGVHWRLPALDRVTLKGYSQNNVLFDPPGSLPCVVIDDHDPDPSRRYKMLFYDWKKSFSPDGITWSEPEKISVPSRIGWSDGLNCLAGWDPLISRYVAYFRPQVADPDEPIDYDGTTIRLIARSESEDMTEWSELKNVLAPDANDPPGMECQTIGVFMYEGMYIGLLCFHEGYPEERPTHYPHRVGKWPAHSAMLGRCYLELVSSKDGIHWTRLPGRTPFIDTDIGGIASGLIWPSNAPVLVDDELWFYYGGSRHGHGISTSQLPCLAKLRRDGFVSLSADAQPGWFTTQPFECPGGKLHVNANARNGDLSVAVIEQDGYHRPEYAKARCAAIDSDLTDSTVTWLERADLNELRGQQISLKYYLRQADLYSFWFE